MLGLDHGQEADAAEQTQTQSTNESTTQSASSGNLYTAGQCTWYVYDKVNGEIGSTWGNANNWASAASSLVIQLTTHLNKAQFYNLTLDLTDMLHTLKTYLAMVLLQFQK